MVSGEVRITWHRVTALCPHCHIVVVHNPGLFPWDSHDSGFICHREPWRYSVKGLVIPWEKDHGIWMENGISQGRSAMINPCCSESVFIPGRQHPCSMDFFEKSYHGKPPWDIGRAQREFVHLEESGRISGDVLDVGCGTGENALYLAGRGHIVWGVDSAPAAIERARRKADERGIAATFLVKDTLHLHEIGRTFDTVIDSGLFHTLSDSDRSRFIWNLSEVLKPGGTYYMLAFSDLEPAGYGPRRITKKEIQAAFSDGWRINEIRAAVFESHTRQGGSRAWLSSITRV